MTERSAYPPDELQPPSFGPGETPLHGYRGDAAEEQPELPAGLSIAISREAGARGGTIARIAGTRLGWQVYPQDLLEYVTQDAAARQEILDDLPGGAEAWVEKQLNDLVGTWGFSQNPSVVELARVVLYLGARGEAIVVGRGAGCILPVVSTLNVRIVAPLEDRVAYMTQWLRLTEDEADGHVCRLDQRRTEFVRTHFHREPTDVHQYDLVLNSSLLGEDRCAELIVQAAHLKLAALDLSDA
jgi:Cytidylate kinase-like family